MDVLTRKKQSSERFVPQCRTHCAHHARCGWNCFYLREEWDDESAHVEPPPPATEGEDADSN